MGTRVHVCICVQMHTRAYAHARTHTPNIVLSLCFLVLQLKLFREMYKKAAKVIRLLGLVPLMNVNKPGLLRQEMGMPRGIQFCRLPIVTVLCVVHDSGVNAPRPGPAASLF